jgi:5-methylcytosine-specific restriction endonuclease McrA
MGYKDPKKQKEYHRKWVAENKEHYNEYMRNQMKIKSPIYYQKFKEKKQKYAIKYNHLHPEKQLKHRIERLKKLGKIFDLSYPEFRDALFSWSKTVRKINGNQCAVCGSKHGLNSHHIFLKSKYPELALNENNGVVLCRLHHRECHGWLNA